MAVSQITIDINELEGQRLGYNGISLNNWTDTLVDAYDAGSKFECGGSIYQVTADEIMGTIGEWGGIANSTLVYSYFNPSSVDFHFTSTAPTWSGSKQGWYGTGGSATYRYLASIYKDGSGNYTQKTILLSREHGITATGLNLSGQAANGDHVIRAATDASITWDESEDQFKIDKNIDDVKSYYAVTTGGDGVVIATQAGAGDAFFYIKKPISAYLSNPGTLSISQRSTWIAVPMTLSGGYQYGMMLNPGYYKINVPVSGTSNLYCTGVFGATEILVAEIVA